MRLPALVEHGLRRLLAQPKEQTAAREVPLTIRTGLCLFGTVPVKDTVSRAALLLPQGRTASWLLEGGIRTTA